MQYPAVSAERTCRRDETHVETETVKTTAEVTKEAACEAKGETKYTAEFTNETFTAQTRTEEDIDALGHDWGEWVVVKEPTAKEDGLQERTCKRDPSHKETQVIPALGVKTYTITLDLSGGTLDGKSGTITIPTRARIQFFWNMAAMAMIRVIELERILVNVPVITC